MLSCVGKVATEAAPNAVPAQPEETTMKRTALLCTTTVVLVGGSLAATVAATAAPSAPRTHTLSFAAHTIASKTSGSRLVEADRLVKSGSTIGYSANTCAFDFAAHTAHCEVTLARAHGQLRAKATINADTGALSGRVVGGTGVYQGATGTVTGGPGAKPDITDITVHWQR